MMDSEKPFQGMIAAFRLCAEELAVEGRQPLADELGRLTSGVERALRESDDRYWQLLASVTDYVYEVTVEDGRAVATRHGPGCVAVTGYSSQDYEANPLLWHSMVHTEDCPAVEEQAARALAGEPVPPVEHRIQHKDGSIRWLRNTIVPHRDPGGRLVGYDGLITDITERRLAEEALRESEEKYRTLFMVSSNAVFVETLEGGILDCNPAACEMFGYSSDEFLELTVEDLVPPEIAATLPDVIREQQERGGIFIEALNLKKGGAPFPCEVSTRLTTIGGEPRVIAYVRDITERKESEASRLREKEAEARAAAAEAAKLELEREIAQRQRAEAALRESEAKFRTLAEQSPNMILINRGGLVVYANETCERTLGYTREELCSPDFDRLSLFAPELAELGRENFLRHLRGEEVPPTEYTLMARDGRRIEVIFATKLIDYEGDRAVLGIVTDITERKREEERLHELQREITDLPAKEQRRIGQELHDNLGQQLTGISMLAKSLSQRLLVHEVEEAPDAEQIFSLVQEAHAQVRDLSRGLMPVEVDAEGLMSALEELAAARDRLPGLHCRFECDTPVAVEDNNVATQLYRIAQEALNNSLLHGRPELVVISLSSDGGCTTLRIADDGVGIGSDVERRAGMGIEIMRYRANAIGAELTIEEPAEGGTTVTCTLRGDVSGPHRRHQ